MKIGNYRPSDLLRGPEIPDEILRMLPKTDLHCHLDGSLRMATFMELARAEDMDLPGTEDEVRARYFPSNRESVMHEFLAHFEYTVAVLQTPESLTRVAYELASDFALDGVWRLEVRFCPLFHTRKGLTPDQAVAAVQLGLEQAEKNRGISTGIIVTSIRTDTPENSLLLAKVAVEWKGRGVVGFDLAGDEKDDPPKEHLSAFYHVLNHNQNVTVHAGENFGADSIHQALHHCGANRIGHGTRLEEDPDLLAYVVDNRIPLEACLSSNLQSCVVDSLDQHPFRTYMQKGLRVCLNTDNTLFARTSPLQELRLAVDTFDLTLLETEALMLNGFKSAFLPERNKGELVMEAIANFAILRESHNLDALKEGEHVSARANLLSDVWRDRVAEAVDWLTERGYTGRVGLVLGSGLGNFVDALQDVEAVSYGDIPGYTTTTVAEHKGRFVRGTAGGVPVLVMQGRLHPYEGLPADQLLLPTAVLACLGIDTAVVTNAAGGLNRYFLPGDLMVIRDQIDLHFHDPLRGLLAQPFAATPDTPADVAAELAAIGRIGGLADLYDEALARELVTAAAETGVPMHAGTYASMSGPAYEAKAEIGMLRRMGCDAVGMSTAPETVLLKRLGVAPVGLSCITNPARETGQPELSHQDVVEVGAMVRDRMAKLLLAFLPRVTVTAD